MSYDRQWDGVVEFFERMRDNSAPSPADSDEIRELKEIEYEATQRIIELMNQLRVLPDFANVSPGRVMPVLTLKPDHANKLIYVSRTSKGFFTISLSAYDGPDTPDTPRQIPEADIVSELQKLIQTLD